MFFFCTKWISDNILKKRFQEWQQSNIDLKKIYIFLSKKYTSFQSEFQKLKSISDVEQFILNNESIILGIGNKLNIPNFRNIIENRKRIIFSMETPAKMKMQNMSKNNNLYKNQNLAKFEQLKKNVYERLRDFNEVSSNLDIYDFPKDCHLIFYLFCNFMDDCFCQTSDFIKKHTINIVMDDVRNIFGSVEEMKRLVMENMTNKFDEIAIVCIHKNISNGIFPYFFVIFDDRKFNGNIMSSTDDDNGVNDNMFGNVYKPMGNSYYSPCRGQRKARHFSAGCVQNETSSVFQTFAENENFSSMANGMNMFSNMNDITVDNIQIWFAQPGKDNVFHALCLFALFVKRYGSGKLDGLELRSQGCTLLQPISE